MEPERSERGRRILLGVTGGIAAYKAPELVRRLRERDFAVRCALTPAAAAFVSPLALEVVTGRPVHREEYLAATGSGAELHIEAAAWADLLLIAPATAHTLASLALGLADNFLLTTALAFRGPVVVAPALHSAMWENPALQARVAELRARGFALVGPAAGPLASGEVGIGRMAEVAEIVGAVERTVAPGDLAGRTVLVTAGPTFEPIDPVRFLGNRSSGKMGFAIAAETARRGARTVLVSGPVALATPPGVERLEVETALEMETAVRERAGACDLVVMAAAVADFRPRERAGAKLKKSAGPPRLDLIANPDILSRLPDWAPDALRVGFAAETGDADAAARQKLADKDAHLLIANDVSRPGVGFGADDNEVTVHRRGAPPLHLGRRPKSALARDLVDLFVAELRARRGEDFAVGR
jgi:phosphopantothenoylcysteine decarboxylase/phosphopantothenate--cysteine ligase